jgi:predicted DsbA family dithiol-disulfide isomerase
MAEIVKAGVMKTPGLIIDDKLVVSGRVAKPREIKELLQEA